MTRLRRKNTLTEQLGGCLLALAIAAVWGLMRDRDGRTGDLQLGWFIGRLIFMPAATCLSLSLLRRCLGAGGRAGNGKEDG